MTRKFAINPDKDTGLPTICNTLRILYRRAQATEDTASLELIADCFDYAKRMDAKLRDYKLKYTSIPKDERKRLGI